MAETLPTPVKLTSSLSANENLFLSDLEPALPLGVESRQRQLELFIVLAFKLVQPARKFGVRREHLSYKRTHDLAIDWYRRLLRNTLESIATPCSVKP